MRVHGTLVRWNDDRGFGFIAPAKGSPDVFVHISAFPRDGVRPHLNELISFEVESGPDGKSRAVRVMRPGQKSAKPAASARHPQRASTIAGAVAMLVLASIGIYTYFQHAKRTALAEWPGTRSAEQASARTFPAACDGRTMCSQMKSCAEAKFFINNCPNTQMDGDNDGVPCESTLCK